MDAVKRDCLRTIALKESFSNELRERGLIIIIIITLQYKSTFINGVLLIKN